MSVITKGASGSLSPQDLARYQSDFESTPANIAAMNAVCTTPVNKVAVNRRAASKIDLSFSHHLPENPATNQKSSGRCWLFAALNIFRSKAAKAMNLEAFEFSQNYAMFFDKLEKANYFLESVLKTLDEPIGSRILDWLWQNGVVDGGQWDMFVNVVEKYGVVPKSVMPETESSSSTGQMCFQITAKLRDDACLLRKAHSAGASDDELRNMKDGYMVEVYRMLVIHLGEPPQSFEWQWRDKDKEFHRDGIMTPQEFFAKYVGKNLNEMVCLIHDPRPGHPLNTAYTVKFLGNIVGGRATEYLNTDLDTMKEAAIAQIKEGDSVWFGCDVGQFLDRDGGVMDMGMFRHDLVYGTKVLLTKAERLQYGHSLMTHAMVFTGVDLDDAGKSRKWRVENSWSDTAGDKGFFQMSDAWFDEFTFEVVVDRKYVPQSVLAALDKAPIELEPWDPMGSLAR